MEPVEVLTRHDLSSVDDPARRMGEIAEAVHASFRLDDSPQLRAVLFDLGTGQRPVLLLAVHHLVVDGGSWRILLEDLDTAYRPGVAGGTASPGTQTAPLPGLAARVA